MQPFQFIHTSDVHLDASFSGSGFPSSLGDRKREAIRGTFRRIMDDGRREGVGLVLIAGDLFEAERVTPDTVEFLRRQFKGLHPARVFIAPGNHDPYMPGSPYREESWPDNVHIFKAEEFQSIEIRELGVRVTGFGFERPHLEDRFFRKLPVLPGDYFNIVLSHGSNLGRIPSGKSKHGPFTVDEIAGKNVQYCALGHYHQQQLLPNPHDGTPAWYPGIPEGRGWDETGPCGYLSGKVVGGNLSVENRICSQYPLNVITVDCGTFSTREQVLDAVVSRREEHFDSNTILRVQLVGALDPRVHLSAPELDERLSGQALYIQWDDRTHPAWDFGSLAGERTLRGKFVQSMNERIGRAAGEEKIRLERARLYGVQALSGHEVRLR
ncbi:MAG: DNA repair exonuclease [Acidobacteria bacterium]|nr:DNA repair exonuclease [Acidobacteriota bacterium]